MRSRSITSCGACGGPLHSPGDTCPHCGSSAGPTNEPAASREEVKVPPAPSIEGEAASDAGDPDPPPASRLDEILAIVAVLLGAFALVLGLAKFGKSVSDAPTHVLSYPSGEPHRPFGMPFDWTEIEPVSGVRSVGIPLPPGFGVELTTSGPAYSIDLFASVGRSVDPDSFIYLGETYADDLGGLLELRGFGVIGWAAVLAVTDTDPIAGEDVVLWVALPDEERPPSDMAVKLVHSGER